MKRKSKRKEIGKKIKPSATKAKTNEAYGVTDETALGGKHQDGDGCTSRPSGVLGDITNSAKQSQKNTKRRGTCLTLAPMELTLVRDKDTATPSIQVTLSLCWAFCYLQICSILVGTPIALCVICCFIACWRLPVNQKYNSEETYR
jgi:hypothetical protein